MGLNKHDYHGYYLGDLRRESNVWKKVKPKIFFNKWWWNGGWFTPPPTIMEMNNGCISNILVTLQIHPFSTSRIMGERVPVKITPKKQIQSQPLPTLQDDPPSITDFSVTKKTSICSSSNEHSLRSSSKGKFCWETCGLVSVVLIKRIAFVKRQHISVEKWAQKTVLSRVPLK